MDAKVTLTPHAHWGRGISLAIIGCMLWGASGTLAAYIFKTVQVSSVWVVFLRLFVAGVLLLLTANLTHRHSVMTIWHNAADRKQLLWFSFFGIMPSQLLYFVTIRFISPATATVLQFTCPIFILLYMAAVNKQLPNLMGVISIVMAVAGTFLLATEGNFHSLSISTIGLVLGLLTGLANATTTVLPVKLLKNYDPKLVCGWGMTLGSIPLLPFFITARQPQLSGPFIVELGFVIVFGTLLAYLCYTMSITDLNPELSGLLNAFEPLTATVLAILFLNFHLHVADVVGGLLILGMTVLQSLPSNHPNQQQL